MEDGLLGPNERRSATDVQRILLERARALARPGVVEEPGHSLEVIVLAVGLERYGIDMDHVREIHLARDVTPFPALSSHWVGLVNLRGRLYPVLDLQRYLGLRPLPTAEGRKLLVVAGGELEIALLVDDVPEVCRVSLDEIGQPLAESAHVARGVVRGVTPDLLTLLDVEMLLQDPQLVVMNEAW